MAPRTKPAAPDWSQMTLTGAAPKATAPEAPAAKAKPAPAFVQVHLNLHPEASRVLKVHAAETGRAVADIIRDDMLRVWLDTHGYRTTPVTPQSARKPA